MRILLEYGPFGGHAIETDGVDKVPSCLWFDRNGKVTSTSINYDEAAALWIGNSVTPDPNPHIVAQHINPREFGYERTDRTAEGYDGVLKFDNMLLTDGSQGY